MAKEHCIAAYFFARAIMRIHSASCLLFLELCLKQCKIVLQRVFGCDSRESLSVFVALTRSGYARIIPFIGKLCVVGMIVLIELLSLTCHYSPCKMYAAATTSFRLQLVSFISFKNERKTTLPNL